MRTTDKVLTLRYFFSTLDTLGTVICFARIDDSLNRVKICHRGVQRALRGFRWSEFPVEMHDRVQNLICRVTALRCRTSRGSDLECIV